MCKEVKKSYIYYLLKFAENKYEKCDFGKVSLLRSGPKKIFAVLKNCTYIKVAHRCRLENAIDEICQSHSKKDGSPRQPPYTPPG
jgi:hypothetical protein